MRAALLAAALVVAAPASSVGYVQSHQNANGGYAEPGDAASPQLTAWAVLGLKAAGIEDSGPAGNLDLAGSLAVELSEHAREALAQRGQRELLAGVGQPCYQLPLITDGMDLAGLYRLASALREQGAA